MNLNEAIKQENNENVRLMQAEYEKEFKRYNKKNRVILNKR